VEGVWWPETGLRSRVRGVAYNFPPMQQLEGKRILYMLFAVLYIYSQKGDFRGSFKKFGDFRGSFKKFT
jgi:hypothetical protein